jgi:hypothetical protein
LITQRATELTKAAHSLLADCPHCHEPHSGEAIRRPGIGGQADGFGGPDPLKDLRGLPEVSFGLVYAAYGQMAGAEASRRS